MTVRPHVSDAQRRARIGVRQSLAPEHRRGTALGAARSVVCLHATESASVHVSVHARSDATHASVDQALYTERSLVKQLAMRRTLFAFPRERLPAVWGSAAARVAVQQREQLVRDLVKTGLVASETSGRRWLTRTTNAVLDHLREVGPSTTSELRRAVPHLEKRMGHAPGTTWYADVPIAPRVLTALAADGSVVRGENAGHWRLNKPRWTLAEDWLGESPAHLTPRQGYAELVGAWLQAFGPGTEADLVWWFGSTKSAVRQAFSDLEVVEVTIDGRGSAYLLADDLGEVEPPRPWAALTPALDPTLMGWRGREHYLDPAFVPELFDTNGNGGQAAWWDGRVVGGWFQHADGRVEVLPLTDLPGEATKALAVAAERTTAFLAGDTVNSIYASPLVRRHVEASRKVAGDAVG